MKSTRFLFSSLMFILVLGLLTACVSSTPAATSVQATQAPSQSITEAQTIEPISTAFQVTDALDRVVEFDAPPQRIVIAGKSVSLIINSVFLFPEALENVVGYEVRTQTGIDFIGAVFPQTAETTKLEKNAGAEQIAPLNPDLVIMKSYLQDSLGKTIEELGVKVVYLDLETPEAFYRDIRSIGKVFNNDARAEQIVSIYERAVKEVTDKTAILTPEQKPNVLMLQYSDTGGEVAFSVPPTTWLQTMLVEMAGGDPVWKDAQGSGGWTVITLEQIAAWNPDMVFIVDYKGNALRIVDGLKSDPTWAALAAVANNMIYAFPLDYLSWDQPDSRWSLGLTWLATKIHPDLFSSISMADAITRFYVDFYGLSDTVIQKDIMPLVKGDL